MVVVGMRLQEATSSAVVSVAGSAGCWGGGGGCPHLASVTMLPENVLVPPLPGTGQNWKFWAPRLG